MSLRGQLLDFLTELKGVDSVAERKALVLYAGQLELALCLAWRGSVSTFFAALLSELSRRGQAALLSFLTGLRDAPQAGFEPQPLETLRAQIESLAPACFAAAFPAAQAAVPGVHRVPAPDMLAVAIAEALTPHYALGSARLRAAAGARAAALAGRVAEAVEGALETDASATDILGGFRTAPSDGEPAFVALLAARLADDVDLAGRLTDLLEPASKAKQAALRRLAALSQEIGAPREEIVSAALGEEVLSDIRAKVEVQQSADTAGEEDAVTGVAEGGSSVTVHDISDSIGVAMGPGAHATVRPLLLADQIAAGTIRVHRGMRPSRRRESAKEAPRLVEEAIRLDVAAPPVAHFEEPFDMAVAVRQPHAPPLTVEDLTEVTSRPGSIFRGDEDEVVRYRVEVTAAGCDVTPENYLLKLRPGTNSKTVVFTITPHRAGRQSVVVTAYQEDETVAAQTRLRIDVQVPVDPGRGRLPDQGRQVEFFTRDELHDIVRLLLQAGAIALTRQDLLFGGMNAAYVSALPVADSADTQLRLRLDALNRTGRLTDGELPFEIFLLNAADITQPLPESTALEGYLHSLRERFVDP